MSFSAIKSLVCFNELDVNNSRLEEGACRVLKNIGKPDAEKLHVRFDGGLGETCSLLYP